MTGSPEVTSLAAIRSRFPALERSHNGHPVAYFDGPGGTQVPRAVVAAMSEYLFHHNANTHWAFATSRETDAALAEARRTVADFLNASPSEIVFGSNMTTLTFHLARTLGRRLGPGDEIVVTELDHHANVDPWKTLATERGVTVHQARMIPETGRLDTGDLERLIGPRTRVVALGAASNALGTVSDVRLAAQLAHHAGAWLFVDAVHYAPHELVDVARLECDFLACSAYKFHGPHLGILYARREHLETLDFPKLQPAPDTAPERAETGTQNHEGIVGAAAAVEFLAGLAPGTNRRERLEAAYQELRRRGHELLTRLWDGLAEIPAVTLFGPTPGTPRTPTLAFTLAGMPSAEVAHRLADLGLFVSHGDFYAQTLVERLAPGGAGLVRVGFACYSTAEETDRLIRAVHSLANTP